VQRSRQCPSRPAILLLTRNADGRQLSQICTGVRIKEFVIKHKIRQLLPLAAALTFVSAPSVAQDDADATRSGKLAFNGSCRTCHSLNEGDNRLGPNLHSIIGRKAGSEDYGYSPALKSSEMVWDAETLNRFIENPDAVIPGNNMKPYGGISDEQTRVEIVSYLESESGGAAEASD
jgi:cytochrome c